MTDTRELTITEVARQGGIARAKEKESLKEAQRKGGRATARKYGKEHFQRIGALGRKSREKNRLGILPIDK
jgi:general stress protein YciG